MPPEAGASGAPALVADLGATNARFALVDKAGVHDPVILLCADFPGLREAAEHYLAEVRPAQRPRQAAVDVAGPVTGDQVSLTNHPWSFSIAGLRGELGLDRLEVVNDFMAVALAVPHLGQKDLVQVGGGAPVSGFPIGIIGAGTGLGVSGLVQGPAGWTPIAGEGGHVTMPAVTEREAAVIFEVQRRHEHVSAERLLSGMGLGNLYGAVTALEGLANPPARDPAAISQAALDGSDPHCVEAVAMFCAMLGTVAGNLALTLGARGGVYIAGGIVPKLGDFFLRSAFRERFEAKGRLRPYLEPMPTYVVTNPFPAFIGLRAILDAGRP